MTSATLILYFALANPDAMATMRVPHPTMESCQTALAEAKRGPKHIAGMQLVMIECKAKKPRTPKAST
jgi:hypothetical protein